MNCSNPSESDISYSFEMFYLSDSTISYSAIDNKPLDLIVLKKTPFLTAENIQTFTVLYGENNKISFYNFNLADTTYITTSDMVRPFILIVNGRKYIAEWWPSLTAIVPKSILLYRTYRNEFEFFNHHPQLDNDYIINTLEKLNVEIKYKNIY